MGERKAEATPNKPPPSGPPNRVQRQEAPLHDCACFAIYLPLSGCLLELLLIFTRRFFHHALWTMDCGKPQGPFPQDRLASEAAAAERAATQAGTGEGGGGQGTLSQLCGTQVTVQRTETSTIFRLTEGLGKAVGLTLM